jgi:cytoskeletal protein CcmA (bactofilin family)/Tfp pilus assembly protein PilV
MRNRQYLRDLTGRNQGGFALVSAMIFLVILLILGASLVQQAVQETRTASRAKKETRAFNQAEAGIDYAAWRLYVYDRPASYPVTWSRTDLPEGTFQVTVDRYQGQDDTLVLQSVGTSQGWQSQVKVVGKFLPSDPGENNGIFDNALFSDTNLTLSGNAYVEGSVHTNGNMTLKGSTNVVGDLAAVGSISGKPAVPAPPYDRTPGVARVPMPTIDLQYYRSIATTIYNGDHTFSGTTTLNGVTFVNGAVGLHGQFAGKGIIVATGQVTVNGNCTLADSGAEFAIVAANNVRVNGTCTIEGFIYAHSVSVASFLGNGTATIVGGVVADAINVNGTINITYKKPTVELPGADSAPAQFAAISWRRLR